MFEYTLVKIIIRGVALVYGVFMLLRPNEHTCAPNAQ